MAQEVSLQLLLGELKEKGISMSALSEKCGMTKPHLSMMFSGKRNMSLIRLNKILVAAEIDIEKIVQK